MIISRSTAFNLHSQELLGINPRDFTECDSVPEGRQDVATGASPWTDIENYGESQRDDMNPEAQTHVVPLGLKTLSLERPTGSRPWLQPVATPWLKHNLATASQSVTHGGNLLSSGSSGLTFSAKDQTHGTTRKSIYDHSWRVRT